MSAAVATGALLDAAGVHKSFGAVRALRGASLRIETGSVHGLVGHNGAGKSTLVRIVAGLTEADLGDVRFGGEPMAGGDRRAAIAQGIWSVPQELTILPDMTVADNVCVGDEPRTGPWVRWREMRTRADETLNRLGLDLSPRAYVGDLRPSQQRMVMIAMAVSRACRLLILDEPTASLGSDEAQPLLELVESLPGRGITVLYVSHRLDEVERLCDRVTIMRDGVEVETLGRGEFDSRALVARMVDELPNRVPRAQRGARSGTVKVCLRGVHGSTLRGVDVDLRPGTITGVTGLMGSGADEVLEVIAGAARPTGGTVEVDGASVTFRTPADALAAGIGYVPGTRAQAALTELTVRENVLASSIARVARVGFLFGGREHRRAAESVAGFGLADRVERRLGELSGGNQQKVMLGRLLAADAQVLVVNDPTAGVDIRARADLHELLRAAADDGLTVVVRCSEPEELLDLADEVYVLAGGHVVRVFAGDDLRLGSLLEAAASSGAAVDAARPA